MQISQQVDRLTVENSKVGRQASRDKLRIVVKAGTNVLTGGSESLDLGVMRSLVDQIAHIHGQGNEILLVTSGAVAAGREALGRLKQQRDVPFRQILASVGQSRLMHTYQEMFSRHSIVVSQALLTRSDIDELQGYLNVRDTLLSLLHMGVVPIINENDVVNSEELGDEVFGDNDTLSALVSNLVDADMLVMLTDIPGLYTADPALEPSAELVPVMDDANTEQLLNALTQSEVRHPWSRGGMKAKVEAALLATRWGVEVVITSGRTPDVLREVIAGEAVGTVFRPTANKVESRKRWFLSGLSARGEILVDSGAAQALKAKNSSLLPVGVTEVHGNFNRREVVLIVDKDGKRVACGVSNYSAQEVAAIRGLNSSKIQETLGHQYGEEVVHRNNLALL